MNGRAHYAKAQELVADSMPSMRDLVRALIHAVLALVAAVIDHGAATGHTTEGLAHWTEAIDTELKEAA